MAEISLFLAVIFVVINGVTMLYYAKSLGYKMKPTGFAYLIGVFGSLMTGSIVPISGQAETLSVSGLMKNLNERVGALLFAAAIGITLGLTGSVDKIVAFAGDGAVHGMMAGVGFILASVGIAQIKEEKRTALISFIVSLAIYLPTHDLVFTIAGSITASALDFCLLQKRRVDLAAVARAAGAETESNSWKFWTREYWEDFKLIRPVFNRAAFAGGLSFICLNVGSNISFGNITSAIAHQEPKLNELSVINSLADVPSILFGGAPIEAIISGTAAAPNIGALNGPLTAGVLMMALTAVLLLTGIIGKLGKYVPAQSVAGFLFVIGFNVTMLPSLTAAFNTGQSAPAAIAVGVTILTSNAFFGLAAGAVLMQLPQLAGVFSHIPF